MDIVLLHIIVSVNLEMIISLGTNLHVLCLFLYKLIS